MTSRPTELSPELNWCEKHGGWDPRAGYRICYGCAKDLAYAELGAEAYQMRGSDFLRYVEAVAMRDQPK